jgi:hypothetical protein
MKPKTTYLVLLIAGTILPYWQFIQWLAEHGLNARLLLQQLFANRISSFFALDGIISGVVLLYFIAIEGSRVRFQHKWLAVLATLLVGGSCGLPLFLYQREKALDQGRTAVAAP